MLTLLGVVPTAVIGPSLGQPVHGGILALAPLVIGLPLLSAAVLLLLGRRADRWGHWLGVLVPLAGFVVGALELFQLMSRPADQRVLDLRLFDWIDTGTLHLQAGLRIDPLTPSRRSTPRTKVVLPAPSIPSSATTSGPRRADGRWTSHAPRRAPAASVASSSASARLAAPGISD